MTLTKIGTDGVKDDAITSGKIPANAVGSSELADQSVTLDKLPHGTSSNDGKFLRANNGADPSFETVSIPAGTTINNNADNRVITGSGSANTLNAESNVVVDSSGRVQIGGVTGPNNAKLFVAGTNSTNYMTFRNTSAGDGSGARWNNIRFQGTQSGGEVSDLVQLQANHDGTADDEKGAFEVLINDGNDGDSLNKRIRVDSDGLKFNGDTAAANALDDYERGTFNAYWLFSPTNTSGTTYTYNAGAYVKIGRFVWFTLHMWTSALGTLSSGAGYCQIDGLPFSVDAEGGWASIAYYDNFGSYNPAVARVTPAERIYIAQHNSGGYSQDLQHTHMNNNSRMHIGGCYSTTA